MAHRLVALLGAVLLAVVISIPQASAASAAESPGKSTCPDIKFFGVHGTNEDGPKFPGDDLAGVGDTVLTVWRSFSESHNGTSAVLEAVDFPKSTLDISLPPSERQVAIKLKQLLDLEAGADRAAKALSNQMWATYQRCGTRTRYVLVGYSQGAWAIDKALRGGGGLTPNLPAMLDLVAGVYLMGDPAWPRSDQWPGRQGLATLVGHGVSAPYMPTRVAGRFRSVCASYAGDVHDAVCMFDGKVANVRKAFEAHFTYKDNGGAKSGGQWLASLVGPPNRQAK